MNAPDIIPTPPEAVIDQLTTWYAQAVLTNAPDSPDLTAARETCERITDLNQAALMLLTELLNPSEPGLPQAANRLAAAVEAMNTPLLAPRPTQAFVFPLKTESTPADHPFASAVTNHAGEPTQHLDVDSRLRIVRKSDAETLRRILSLDNLQKTVREAAAGRLRRLEKEGTA